MLGRAWRRLGLMARLAISCGAVAAAAICILVVASVQREADSRAAEYTALLESSLTVLVTALTGPALLGDYTSVSELLHAFARDASVARVEWVPTRGTPVAVTGPPVERQAPPWFEARMGLPTFADSRRIVVGGVDYGRVSLRLDSRPEIDKIWTRLTSATVAALIGVGTLLGVMLLMLGRGLRPLTALVSGVHRFEGGDFGARVAPVGPPEIVSSIVAFNRMAERVGAVVDSLRESEARNRRLAMIVEQSSESILTRDLQGLISSWNKGAERLFGWTAAEAVGKSGRALHMRDLGDGDYERMLARMRSADTWTGEGVRVTKTGAVLEVSTTRAPLLDENGCVIGEIGIARDITELKKAQALLIAAKEELEARVLERTAELAAARDDAEAANRSKSAFLATMSHEIRTPMNGVVGMIDVLERTPLKTAQADMVRTIRESAYALLGIVDDVLDFSKIEAGRFQVDSEPMALTAVVEGVCDTLGGLADKKGVELTLVTDPALPARVLGDATRLRQVLLNLTGNAIKFSGDQDRPGRVSVRVGLVELGAQTDVVEFEVADNGIGMSEDVLSRLFAPFTQADPGTTRRYGGTGLGLSISRRLVELMKGSLEVKSEPGRGSVFTLRLPVAAAPPALETEAEAATFGPAAVRCVIEGERAAPADAPGTVADTAPGPLAAEPGDEDRLILVAEDNEINQKVLRRQLALLGLRAHIVGTGREALECFRRDDYPLLLTDLHMPQMDGYELTVAIRGDEAGGRRIPIVALTANALKGEADRCRALGMDDYMTKPVQLADLAAMLRKWLPGVSVSAPGAKPDVDPARRAPAIDVARIKALVGDEPQIIAELLQDFGVGAVKAAQRMGAACEAGEAAAVAAVAHRLRSSAHAMGARALGELCAKMEVAGNAGELAAIARLWPAFQAEVEAVDEFLRAAEASA